MTHLGNIHQSEAAAHLTRWWTEFIGPNVAEYQSVDVIVRAWMARWPGLDDPDYVPEADFVPFLRDMHVHAATGARFGSLPWRKVPWGWM